MPKLTNDEFKKMYKDKGWTPSLLAERWGFTNPSRIHQIARDENRAEHYVDALRGLPHIIIKYK